ncbi:hypothetical protein CBS147332_976 [Penicillium roqueforti]|nr:hypothetical protein CBS147332_976 [Penicillium roqueforti]KAI3122537.1 hypothetical protein CBS147331_987 [Penicillium roqueforti]
MSMPVEQPGSRGRNHFLAAIHVARLRHNVLITGAASPPVHTAQDLAIRHLEELQKIQSALDIDVEVPFASCSMSNEFQLWTTLSCLTTRLIINETFPESQYHDLVHSTAQNAIFIITSMGMDTGEKPEDQPLLPLLLSTESIAATSVLASNIIQEPNATTDVELLKSFHQFLKKSNMICPHITIATRLEALVSAILEFVAVVRLLPDSCPRTDLTPGPRDTSVDFTFLDMDQLL